MIDKVLAHIKAQESEYVERLNEFLRIKSISTDSECNGEMRRCAEWIHGLFEGCGMESQIVETKGHPCVVADTGPVEGVEGGGPTVLVYGHYDVQPTGDRSLWNADPFEPTEVDGAIFARGAADDKGQVLTHMLAAEAWKKVVGKLPARFKFLVEGEEEVGSPNLEPVVRDITKRLACDYVVISDTAKLDADTPAVTYGTKGLIYKEIEVVGPRQDLHSGAFGGTVTNPGNALCQIIAAMRDANNRVTIPGFYDDVQPLSEAEKQLIASLPYSDEEYLKMVGSPSLEGEAGYTTPERRGVRPTLDINGLFGGYMAPGSSTIIPHKVGAKVSMRIVPNQDPERISAAFDTAVQALAPAGVKVSVTTHAIAGAYVCPLDLPGLTAAKNAIRDGYGKEPVMIREGGTLPILPMFKEILAADSLMIGLSQPDCNLHGPNEFFHKSDFWAGIRTSACLAQHLAQLS